MNKLLLSGIAIVSAITLSSCEGGTTREWKIKNESGETLKVYANFSSLNRQKEDTLSIESGRSQAIAITDTRGGQKDPGLATQSIETIYISSLSGKSLKRSPEEDANWSVETTHENKVPSEFSHQFTFTVSKSDLQ